MSLQRAEAEAQAFQRRLRSQWLRWGLVPALGLGLLSLAASWAHAAPEDLASRAAELRLQAAMACAAAAFLAGFWWEGYRASVDKLLLHLTRRRGLSLERITSQEIQAAAEDLEELLTEAHGQALVVGWLVSLSGLVGALAGLPPVHAAVVVVMAGAYQLYLFSRHAHAADVVGAAASGELSHEAGLWARRRAFRPAWPQRVAMWLGWRPRLQAEGNPVPITSRKKRRH